MAMPKHCTYQELWKALVDPDQEWGPPGTHDGVKSAILRTEAEFKNRALLCGICQNLVEINETNKKILAALERLAGDSRTVRLVGKVRRIRR
jgi:hypothetical protein